MNLRIKRAAVLVFGLGVGSWLSGMLPDLPEWSFDPEGPKRARQKEVKLVLEEELSLGGEKSANDFFGKINDIDVLADGTILVLDGRERTLRRFKPDGTYLPNIGRPGQGPGEFQSPRLISVAPGTEDIAVVDFQKIHVFRASGEFLRSISVARNIYDLYSDGEGRFFANTWRLDQTGKEIVALEKIDAKGDCFPLVEIVSDWEAPPTKKEAGAGETVLVSKPRTGYEKRFLSASIDAQTHIWALSDSSRMTAVDQTGKKLFEFEGVVRPERFSENEKDAIRSRIRNPAARSSVVFPEFKALFNRMFVDRDGRLYLRRKPLPLDDPKVYAYEVYNRTGEFLYRFQVPINVAAVQNGRLYGILSDEENGLEYVKRYKIVNDAR
jgi:hypothetical protein